MDSTTPDWSTLPLHLLALIGGRLHTRIDTLHFRAVCNSFRSSVPPPHRSFFPYSDLQCYYENKRSNSQSSFLIAEYTFYAIEPIFRTANAQRSTRPWLVKVEDTNSGKVRLQHLFSIHSWENYSDSLPNSLNLLDYRVKEISKGYRLEYAKDKQKRFKEIIYSAKVVVSADEFAMLASLPKVVGWRSGNKRGEKVDIGCEFSVNYITYHKKKFYVYTSDGITVAVDPKSFKATRAAPPLRILHRPIGVSLVSSSMDLLLIHNSGLGIQGNSENTCPVRLDIFKLDEEKRKWIKVKNELEDRLVFLGLDWSFSVSAKECRGWKRNCVYFAEGRRAAIFNLKNNTCDWLSDSTGNSEIFWPPPTWIFSEYNPSAVLVSSPLNGKNYTMWSKAMIKALTARNKYGFVNGSITKPSTKDPKFDWWKQCDDLVASWILNTITPELVGDAIYAGSAKDLWIDLEKRFSQTSGPRIFELHRRISSTSQGQDSITTYYSKLKALWDELNVYSPMPSCSCESSKTLEVYKDRDCTMQFLMGLNEIYMDVRSRILFMTPTPTVDKVFSLLLQEERQHENRNLRLIHDSTALVATRGNNRSSKLKPICNFCGKRGHIKEKCYKLHGYPPCHKL